MDAWTGTQPVVYLPPNSGDHAMICNACSKESSDAFKFCPYCGNAINVTSSVIGLSDTAPETDQVVESSIKQLKQTKNDVAKTVKVGTFVFVSFAIISLLVSIVNGFIPIYLLEAVGWAALGWYWEKKTHSEIAKAIVVILAVTVAIGEIVHIAIKADSLPQPGGFDNVLRNEPQPKPQSPCPSGLTSGARITEIPPNQVGGANGKLWYESPDKDLRERGGWFFHFSAFNNTKNFCVTTIEYDVQLESDGIIQLGHGKKHIEPLSPGWSYTPQQKDPDDEVTFAAKPKDGTLSSWKIAKAYGFLLTDSVSQ
jgi:hypothetical protein